MQSKQQQQQPPEEEEGSETLPRIVPAPGIPPLQNASFSIELYSTMPSGGSPSRQAFYTVSQNQRVFVEVDMVI